MARPKAAYDPTLKPRAVPYACPELMAFWASQPGGLASMPPQVREYILSQNDGIWPGEQRAERYDDEQAPF